MKAMFFALIGFAMFNGCIAALGVDYAIFIFNLIVAMFCSFVAGMYLPRKV